MPDNAEPLVASVDAGTSSVRCTIFSSKTKELLAIHQLPIPMLHPRPECVEEDPLEIINLAIRCIDEAVKQLEISGRSTNNVVCIGITNQRETTVLWDPKTGKPYYNAIVWMDNRTSVTVNELLSNRNDKSIDQLRPLCGLPLSPYFSALKYRWLVDNVPQVSQGITQKRCLFGTVDSWLIWNLTGGTDGGIHMTDVTNASRTMLMNIDTLCWDPQLSSFFNLPLETLPKIRSSSEIYGNLRISSLKGIPISGCVGDQHAALIGQSCFKEGQIKCTYGTGSFIVCNTGTEKIVSKCGLLTTLAYKLGDAPAVYALEGSITVAGAMFSWLKNNLNLFDNYAEMEKLAASVSSTKGVYFVPAFQGLYAPYWDAKARGLICGLTMESDKRHIVRAALEAVCFQIKDVLDAIAKDYGANLSLLKVDGGMVKNSMLMQLQADISGIRVVRQSMQESTAFGAALAAGMAKGIEAWSPTCVDEKESIYSPLIGDDERQSKYNEWKTAISRCRSADDSGGRKVPTAIM